MKQSGQQGRPEQQYSEVPGSTGPQDKLRETLSALMDAETDDLELRRLLKALDEDSDSAAELLQSWGRYHLVQDVLHGHAQPAKFDISAAVAEQLGHEDSHHVRRGFTAWQQNLTRIAVAACVALVFAVTLQTNLDSGPTPDVAENSPVTSSNPLDAEPTLLASGDDQEFSVDPVAEQRLRSYLQGIAIDVTEPVVTEHIQDSPLYRLVNEVQD